MTQNRSHAVMAQRHEAHDSLDLFPTPPWATRALCEHAITLQASDAVWEPACGLGHMEMALTAYTPRVFATDIDPHGRGNVTHDFLMPMMPQGIKSIDWVITNPPFALAEEFILRGLSVANIGVAMLVRSVFSESVGRYKRLFSKFPPSKIAQFTERVPMIKGRLDRKASSATSYAWFIWQRPFSGTRTDFTWIPPCRVQLEHDGDYQ